MINSILPLYCLCITDIETRLFQLESQVEAEQATRITMGKLYQKTILSLKEDLANERAQREKDALGKLVFLMK